MKCAGDKRGLTGATSTGSLVACMVEWVENDAIEAVGGAVGVVVA